LSSDHGSTGDYDKRKERARRQQAEQSQQGRDIGPIPKVVNPERRKSCEFDLRLYLDTYHKPKFPLPWSSDHLAAIEKIQDVILNGGYYAYAMARGSGKTTIVVPASEWAASYGHRRFVVPIGATGPHAQQMLQTIRLDFETNDLLFEDFPEICYPIRKLDGINNRASGQMSAGERTRIKLTDKFLQLPSIREGDGWTVSSGVTIKPAGLLAAVRGMQMMNTAGEVVRPDLTLLDDPQTDESARRPAQVEKRKRTIENGVLGLAGPGKKIACAMPCTIIAPNDLAAQYLDRDRYPEWRGQISRLLRSMPSEEAMKLWEKYREIRQDSLREHEDIRDATQFYADNREAMDDGAEASWEHRKNPDQLSAIQFGMDQWAENENRFWAEFQNQPLAEEQADVEILKPADLLLRINGLDRGDVPEWCTKITAFIDVQQDVLPYAVVAWSDELRGSIIEYGTFPEQHKRYWTLRTLDRKLRSATGQPTIETAITVGLSMLLADLADRDYCGHRIRWIGVDANWELSRQIVYQAAKSRRIVHPYHGRFVGAASLPMVEWKKITGERQGMFWRMRPGRIVNADINHWKSIVCKRLKADIGSRDSIDFYGNKPRQHECLADQLSAEYGVTVKGRGREVQEWKLKPGQDNHWFDCLVGAAVGASILGAGQELSGRRQVPEEHKQTKRRSYAEIMAARRASK
jgi:hypothetical protein